MLAGPITVMTKQNASLKPTSGSFRSLTIDNLASNNSSTTSMSSSTTDSHKIYQNAPHSTPIHPTQRNTSNQILGASTSKVKVYSLDDMSPSRKGLNYSNMVTKPAYFPGDMINVVDSSFLVFKSASKEVNKPIFAKDSYDYTTLYKDNEGFDFEIQRNSDTFSNGSRFHSRKNSRTIAAESPNFAVEAEKKIIEHNQLVQTAIETLNIDSSIANAVINETSGAVEEYAEPLEVFTECGVLWHTYMAETGDMYYLDMNAGHSQWEDPRLSGVVVTDYGEENVQPAVYDSNDSASFQEPSVSSRSSSINSRTPMKSPPKSPSPKSPTMTAQGLIVHEMKPPRSLNIDLKDEIDRSSFSPTSTIADEEEDEKETMLYRFDGLSVSRNLRWLDEDADSSFVDDESMKPVPAKSDAVYMPTLGIAELLEATPTEEEKLLISDTELGPESQSRLLVLDLVKVSLSTI